MIIGVALGVVLRVVTGNIVFFPVFVGACLSIGLVVDNAPPEKDGEA